MPEVKPEKENLYSYFKKRGISKQTIDKYGIETNNDWHIIFPYKKDGVLVNLKYRKNIGEGKKTFKQEAETEKTFFGMDLITDFKQLVIVEGEMDVLSLAEIGIESVSVPQGASENKLECIDNCWGWLSQFEKYIIAVDNDSPGDKLKENLLSRLDKYKCHLVDFGRFKDANEVLINEEGGAEELKTIIEANKPIDSNNVVNFVDKIDNILDFYENGFTRGYSTGWKDLDEKFTIKTGYLMIVTGIPSRGKSFWTDNLLYNLSVEQGLKHFVCSFENSDENHFARIASMYKEKRFSKGNFSQEELSDTINFVSDHFYRIKIDRLWNIDKIIEEAEYAVKRYGIKTLTIDPYNRLDNSTSEREDKYIGSILSKLSMTAKRLNILIVFIAHPKKLGKDEKIPTMYSISGSSDWYNMADYGIVIHRDRGEDGQLENKMKVIIAKIKDFNLGDPSGGEVELEYMPSKFKLMDKASFYGNYKTTGSF